MAWPFAGLRGMPWLGRTLRAFGGGDNSAAVIRTVDPVRARRCSSSGCCSPAATRSSGTGSSAVLPDVAGQVWCCALFLAVAVGGTVLAAAYLSLNPPTVERPGVRRPAQHRFEWLAPVLLVDAVFVLFLAAQAAAFFGGHDYIQRTTGLTYADYVHQGFGQLTFATALTLLVVWAAARKAGDDRAPTGGGCAARWARCACSPSSWSPRRCTGWTSTRTPTASPGCGCWSTSSRAGSDWSCSAVLVAGIGLRGRWLPRMALLSGAALLLGLAIANPDAWIAQHNIERYEATGKVDCVLPPRARAPTRRRRPGDRCRPSRRPAPWATRSPEDGRLGRLEPVARARRRRAGRLRRCRTRRGAAARPSSAACE